MGFRFRRSIKILPGVRLHVSKSGVSTSIGTRGATINISKRGTRGTVGIPGTGISYSEKLDAPETESASTARPGTNYQWVLWLVLAALLLVLVLR